MTVAGAVAAAVVVAVAIVAAVLVYEDLTAPTTQVSIALGVTAFALLIAGVLGAVAVALLRGRRGGRNPAVAFELLLLAPAYFMINGGAAVVGWPLAVVCLAVIALVIVPAPPS